MLQVCLLIGRGICSWKMRHSLITPKLAGPIRCFELPQRPGPVGIRSVWFGNYLDGGVAVEICFVRELQTWEWFWSLLHKLQPFLTLVATNIAFSESAADELQNSGEGQVPVASCKTFSIAIVYSVTRQPCRVHLRYSSISGIELACSHSHSPSRVPLREWKYSAGCRRRAQSCNNNSAGSH